jgi:hypothetical protein
MKSFTAIHCFLAMSKSDMGTKTKSGVLDIHFDGKIHLELRCLNVLEKSVTKSVNRKTTHLQRLAFVNITGSRRSNYTSTRHTDAINIYEEARLNCSGEFTRAWFGPEDKIVPTDAFGVERFRVELPPRSFWLSQETSKILPLHGNLCTWLTFYGHTDRGICNSHLF